MLSCLWLFAIVARKEDQFNSYMPRLAIENILGSVNSGLNHELAELFNKGQREALYVISLSFE